MDIQQLEMTGAHAHFDELTRTICITYSGELTCKVTLAVHDWIGKVAPVIGIDNIHGTIIDFREVSKFDKYYLTTVRSVSRNINEKYNFSRVPVSLIVSNAYQEQMLMIAQSVLSSHGRLGLVRDFDNARHFIREWHLHH